MLVFKKYYFIAVIFLFLLTPLFSSASNSYKSSIPLLANVSEGVNNIVNSFLDLFVVKTVQVPPKEVIKEVIKVEEPNPSYVFSTSTSSYIANTYPTYVNNVYNSYVTKTGGGSTSGLSRSVTRSNSIQDDTLASLQTQIDALSGGGGSSQWTTTGSDIYFSSGNVGIGTTTPSSALSVVGDISFTGDLYQDGVLFTGGGGGGDSFSTSTTRGVFSSSATGLSYATSTGIFSLTSGYEIPLTASTSAWNTFYATPSSRITAGTNLSWSSNTLNISSTPTFASTTLSNFTAGSIPFFGAGGSLNQNNGNLFWDNTNARLGIGTTTPASTLSVVGTTTLSNLHITGSNDAPAIRLSPKTLLLTPQDGGLEYNGTNLYYTFGATRQKIDPFTVYVDPDSGSDSNTGTLSSPVQTISKAVSLIGTSGTIVLGGGTYVNERINLASIKSIQVQTKQNERAKVILGEAVTSFTQVDTNTWRSTNTISSVPSTNSAGTGGTDADYIFEHGTAEGTIPADEQHALLENRTTLLDHYRLRLATSQANVNAGNGRWWYSGGYLYISATDGGDPNGTTYYVPNTTSGMSFVYNAQSDSMTEYVKIEGVEVYYGNTGFDLTYVRDYELNGVTAYGNYGTGITGQTNRSGVEKHVKVLANGDDGIAHLTEANPTSNTTDGNYLSVDVLAIGNGDEGISGHYNVTETIQGGLMYYNYSGGITPALGAHTSAYNVTTMRNTKGFNPCCSTSGGSAGTTTLNVYNSRSYKDTYGFFADGEDILNVYDSTTDGTVSGVAALGSGSSGKINFYGHTDYSGSTSIYGGAGGPAGISYKATTQYASSTFANNANINLWGGLFRQYSDNGSTLVNLVASSSRTYFNGGNLDANSFGIGTTTGTSRLTIVGKYNGTSKLFSVANDLPSDGELFTILQRGSVGIGTSNPSTSNKLTVAGNSDFRTVSINSEGYDVSSNLHIHASGITDGAPTYRGSIILEGSGGVSNNGGIEFQAYGGTGGGARILSPYSVAENYNNPIVFQTRRISASWTERMRIQSTGTGEVGIGTTSPAAQLHTVSGAVGTVGGLFQGFSNSQTADIFQLGKYPGATPGFVFTAAGNVGIGTTTPNTKLDVQGDIAFGNYGSRMGDWLGTTGYNAISLNGLWDSTSETFVMGGPDSTDPILYMNVPTGGEYNLAEGGIGGGNIAVISSSHGIAVNMGSASEPTHTFLSDNLTGMFSPGGSSLAFSAAGTEKLRIDSSGNVGIGTTTPSVRLDVYGNLNVATGTTPALFANTANGRIGIGTASPSYPLSVSIPNTAQTMVSFYSPLTTLDFAYDGSANMRILSSRSLANFAGSGYDHLWYDNADLNMVIKGATGNVGIGTSTPSQKLVVGGTIQSTDLLGGATTLSTDVSGNIIRTPSDGNLKENVEPLTSSLEKLLQLEGVSYDFKDKNFGSGRQIGFIAQQVQTIFPEVVSSGGDYLSLNYGNLVAVVVEAVKELADKVGKMSEIFKTKQIITDKLCVTKADGQEVCITGEQLQEIVGDNGGQQDQNNSSDENENESEGGTSNEDVTPEPEPEPEIVSDPEVQPETENEPEPETVDTDPIQENAPEESSEAVSDPAPTE